MTYLDGLWICDLVSRRRAERNSSNDEAVQTSEWELKLEKRKFQTIYKSQITKAPNLNKLKPPGCTTRRTHRKALAFLPKKSL